MLHENRILLLILITILVFACDINKNRVDRSLYEAERNQKAIRQVSEIELIEQAYTSGKIMADSGILILSKQADLALSENDRSFNCTNVQLNVSPDGSSLSLIGRSGSRNDSINSILYDSYASDLLSSSTVEQVPGKQFVFAQPIYLSSSTCRTCHTSTDTEEGSFIGFWKAELSKKSLVLEIPAVKD